MATDEFGRGEHGVPSLVRFIIVVAVLATLVYGVMLALVTFVHVTPRPMEEAIPASKLK